MLPIEVNGQSDAPSGAVASSDANDAAASASYPFKKYRMWFESFELRKPTRPTAGGSHGLTMGSSSEQ